MRPYVKILFVLAVFVTVACSNDEHCYEGPLYCYSTLGDPECYAAPLEGQEHRLIALVQETQYNTPIACKHRVELSYE